MNQLSKKIASYLVIIITFFLLGKSCNTDFNCSNTNSTTDTTIVIKSDTIYQRDTIFKFKYKTINKPHIVYLDTNRP